MKILGTICARGGSKGLPSKNIKLLLGKPLILYTVEQAMKNKLIDRVVLSTDSQDIMNVVKSTHIETPFLRPNHLATDTASKIPVLQHIVQYYKEHFQYEPDYVVDLDPTSPLREQEDIEKCIECMINTKGCDLVITGFEAKKNPYFNMVEKNEDETVKMCKTFNNKYIYRRQDAPKVFSMNASVYVWKREYLMNTKDLLSGNVSIVEMPENRSIDIDNAVDFKLVELLMKEKK